jgi:hypothetical protein
MTITVEINFIIPSLVISLIGVGINLDFISFGAITGQHQTL